MEQDAHRTAVFTARVERARTLQAAAEEAHRLIDAMWAQDALCSRVQGHMASAMLASLVASMGMAALRRVCTDLPPAMWWALTAASLAPLVTAGVLGVRLRVLRARTRKLSAQARAAASLVTRWSAGECDPDHGRDRR